MISPTTITAIQDTINRSSHLRKKAEAMGFRFGPAIVEPDASGLVLSLTFTCVCGKFENIRRYVSTSTIKNLPAAILEQEIDLVAYLWMRGSFSREHLVNDGYTEEQIQEILARGEAYELASPLNPTPSGIYDRTRSKFSHTPISYLGGREGV